MTDKSAASIKAERAARPAIELAQDGAELSPKNPCDLSHAHLRLGIDVGSTTVKLAVIDDNDHLVYANYERHHTDVRATAKELFARAQRVIGDTPMRVSITGSGGMLLAKWLDLEFVQEVIASKRAVETLIPQTDVRHRARRRGRQDHLLRQRHRAAHERHLRRRHGRVHRPDGVAAAH